MKIALYKCGEIYKNLHKLESFLRRRRKAVGFIKVMIAELSNNEPTVSSAFLLDTYSSLLRH